MALRNPPSWLQGGSHPAEHDRLLIQALVPQEGVVSSADLLVAQAATPAMSVTVASGSAFIRNDLATWGGTYHVVSDATATVTIAAANATNPRNDLVVARVRDATYSGATNAWDLTVITGTPAASPADPAIPTDGSYLVLARVRVNAAASSILNANITDLRPRAAVPANVATPVGAITGYAGSAAPAGWLLCDGSAASRTTYSALFAAIGTTYGAPDGTTFSLPDLRGRVPLGAGTGTGLTARALGATGGAETVTLAMAEVPGHSHTINDHTHGGATDYRAHGHGTDAAGQHSHTMGGGTFVYGFRTDAAANGLVSGGVERLTFSSPDQAGSHSHNVTGDGNHNHGFTTGGASDRGTNAQGGGGAHQNMQPWLAVNYIIRAF